MRQVPPETGEPMSDDKKNEERMLALMERITVAVEKMTPERQVDVMFERLPEIMERAVEVVEDMKRKEKAEREERDFRRAFNARKRRHSW